MELSLCPLVEVLSSAYILVWVGLQMSVENI